MCLNAAQKDLLSVEFYKKHAITQLRENNNDVLETTEYLKRNTLDYENKQRKSKDVNIFSKRVENNKE